MNNRQSLILLTAITAALAAPLSFAQSAHSGMTAQEHAAAQATTPAATTTATEDAGAMAATPATPATPATDGLAATAATPATPATPASSARKVSWSALDTDSNGTLSKAETASVESLSKVFDKADANADGALSTDEYKAYLAMNGKMSPNKK